MSSTDTTPEYKLIYFNTRGMAELIRWIFHYADIPFTDERVEEEDWPERKKTIRGGKLPVLQTEGKLLPQCHAIARFLAAKTDLVPQNPLDAAFCDALAETIKDVLSEKYNIKKAQDKTEEEKQKDMKQFVTNTLEPLLDRLNKRIDGREWIIADKITWADLAIGRYMEFVFPEMPQLAAKYPKLKSHVDKIENLPRIKEWIQRRPVTLI